MKNSQKYRPPLKRTVDSFIDDADKVTRPNHALGQSRHTQIRRDQDNVKPPNITLYDIDFAIKSFFENVIKPKVVENDSLIDVPILYMNSEKWSNVQKEGYMRDKKGGYKSFKISCKNCNGLQGLWSSCWRINI
jgi:hypothetical protein